MSLLLFRCFLTAGASISESFTHKHCATKAAQMLLDYICMLQYQCLHHQTDKCDSRWQKLIFKTDCMHALSSQCAAEAVRQRAWSKTILDVCSSPFSTCIQHMLQFPQTTHSRLSHSHGCYQSSIVVFQASSCFRSNTSRELERCFRHYFLS